MTIIPIDAPRRRYVQVAERLLDAIARGDYPMGSRLPGDREIAVMAQVQVSGRGDSHPPALAEPGVRVSPHRAPTGRLWVRAIRCQWTKRLGWR